MERRKFWFERIIRNNEKKIWNIWKKRRLNSEKDRVFSISFHNSICFSSIFFIYFLYSTYFSSIFSKSFHYSTYFSSIFSIENSDLKESLETMKKRYGTYGRNVGWIVKKIGKIWKKSKLKRAMAPTAVLNLHIKSYSPYFNIILAHTGL
jgi:hypothetical protein